ncbi:hypothetical protein RQP46_000997 [Phenoliferia psychrophenolica]
MLSFTVAATFAALLLQPAVARSGLPYVVPRHVNLRRQGTLTPSTDPTDFGTCTTPEISGALGFDGRTEFSLYEFICDTLVNTCGASTAAHDLCTATETAVGAGKNDGALADKFVCICLFYCKAPVSHGIKLERRLRTDDLIRYCSWFRLSGVFRCCERRCLKCHSDSNGGLRQHRDLDLGSSPGHCVLCGYRRIYLSARSWILL